MNIFLTGATGFIGLNLRSRLLARNNNVFAFEGDVVNFENVFAQLQKYPADVIVHLAGLSHVQDCEKNPQAAAEVNILGTINILETLVKLDRKVKFIYASTGQIYDVPTGSTEVVLSENSKIVPKNVYARTKHSSELLIENYFENFNLGSAVVLRLFNHTHHKQKGDFIFLYLYSALIEAAKLKTKISIPVGNLDLYRDFGTVDDLMSLFEKVIDRNIQFKFDVFNICSGQKRKLRDVAGVLAQVLEADASFVPDPSRFREHDPKVVLGSCLKAMKSFDWEPRDLTNEEFVRLFLS